jgi:cGMP-dependent protein kinase 1
MGKCVSVSKNNKNLPNEKSFIDRVESLPEIKSATVFNKVPKDQSKLLISSSLKTHYLFSGLDKDDMEILLAQMKFYSVPSDQIVFEQGAKGKKFYIIETGKLEVYRNNVKKTVLDQGKTFGEMALLTDSARRATIKTIENSSLWGIGREQFRSAIKQINSKNFEVYKEFISNLQIFSHLPSDQIIKLAESVVQQSYSDNYRIICEGDEGMIIFIIKEGNAVAKMKGLEKFRISQGEIFGEAAVLEENHIRNFSVYSVGPVNLLSISRDSIISIIGENFKEIIYKNQAKNSLSSNKLTRNLSKETIQKLLDSAEWRFIKPGETALCGSISKENVYILCLGSITSSIKNFSHFEVIGFRKQTLNPDEEFIADTEAVIGIFKRQDLEILSKNPWKKLKKELKTMHFLSKVQIFTGFTQSKLRYIASHTTLQEFDKKDLIFKHNDEAYEFYVIKRGTVEIFHNGKVLRVLGKYDAFGDRCLEDNIRPNSAKAMNHCLVLVIKSQDFRDVMDEDAKLRIKKIKAYLASFSLNQLLMVKDMKSTHNTHSFLAYVEHNDSLFHVRVMPKSYFDTKNKFDLVLQQKNIEVQTESQLIVKLVKTFNDANFLYLVYEHIESCPLLSLLNKKIGEDYSKFLTACLLNIIEYLHEKDIAIRALNPENFIVNGEGYPIITNFRKSKIIKGRTYTKLDDPVYAAPEVYSGKGYTKAIDLWGLGILIYQFLYSSLPFDMKSTDTALEILQKTTQNELKFPHDSKYIRGNEVITSLLSIDPTKRPSINDIKYSRWLDSIDWERLKTFSLSPPFKPEILSSRVGLKPKKLISLTRHLNVTYTQEMVVVQPLKKVLKLNWDKHF